MAEFKSFYQAGRSKGSGRICPGCQSPLGENIHFCYHCKSFIDADSGRLLTPETYQDREYDALLRYSHRVAAGHDIAGKKRKFGGLGKLLIIIGAILLLTCFLAPYGGVCLLVGLFLYNVTPKVPPEILSVEDAQGLAARYILPNVLGKVFDVKEIRFDWTFPASLARDKGLVTDSYSEATGNAFIRGVYKELPLEMANLTLKRQDPDGGKDPWITVFKGQLLTCGLNHPLPGTVTVRRREKGWDGRRLTGHDEFDRMFSVEAKDTALAKQLLPRPMTEYLLGLAREDKGRVALAFAEDGQACLAYGSGSEMFKVNDLEETSAQLRERFKKELEWAEEFVSILSAVKL